MDFEGMSEEDMFMMAIAASLADDHQVQNRSESGAQNHAESSPEETHSSPPSIPKIFESANPSETQSTGTTSNRNFGIGELIGTGYHECDNEEDAITGVLLKELPPCRVVRFDVTHSRSSGNLSRQGSGQSLQSCDSLSGEGFDTLTIIESTGEFYSADLAARLRVTDRRQQHSRH